MAQDNLDLSQLTALIESIVAQTLSRSRSDEPKTWLSNDPRFINELFSYYQKPEGPSSTDRLFDQLGQIGSITKSFESNLKGGDSNIGRFQIGATLSGLGGIYDAYKMGDPLSGAAAGAQLGAALGSPLIGAAVGLIAGLFSHGIDKWQRPKFKDADKAYDKLFSLDRGERDEFFLPESAYFRAGSGASNIVIQLGNRQLDDHIRESLTNNYASQLQRGLVF